MKDCCFARTGLKHIQCGAMLETDECTQQHVASQQPGGVWYDLAFSFKGLGLGAGYTCYLLFSV